MGDRIVTALMFAFSAAVFSYVAVSAYMDGHKYTVAFAVSVKVFLFEIFILIASTLHD